MSYFKHFERVKYNGIDTVNILNSVITRYRSIKNTSLYYYYTLLDGERPEQTSYKVYSGNTEYWWLILAINNIVDPYHDWLMSSHEMEGFLKSKYGDDLDSVHHFENITDDSIEDGYNSTKWQAMLDNGEELPHDIRPVSNSEYEILLNERKRNIKIISERYIDDIQREFIDLMNRRNV